MEFTRDDVERLTQYLDMSGSEIHEALEKIRLRRGLVYMEAVRFMTAELGTAIYNSVFLPPAVKDENTVRTAERMGEFAGFLIRAQLLTEQQVKDAVEDSKELSGRTARIALDSMREVAQEVIARGGGPKL